MASGLSFLNSPTFSSSHKIKLGTTPTLSTSHIVHQTNQRTGKRVVDLNEVLTAQQFMTLIEKSTTVAYYLKIFQLITRRKLPKVTTLLTFGTSSLCNRGSLLSGGEGEVVTIGEQKKKGYVNLVRLNSFLRNKRRKC